MMFLYVVEAPATDPSTMNFLPKPDTSAVIFANPVNAPNAMYALGTLSYTDKRSENATLSIETSSCGSNRVGTSMSMTTFSYAKLEGYPVLGAGGVYCAIADVYIY